MKKPTQSPEATTAKQTSSVKQLNPATCTKPSAVQQPSYSTMTSSQTLTDKTSCTTTRQLSSKPVKQVSTYHITELIHLTKAIASMDLPTDPDFENESILMNVCQDASHFQQDKILDPFQTASLCNDFSQFPPFGPMGIFNHLKVSKSSLMKKKRKNNII